MSELTGLGSVLRGLGYLYWAVALGLLALALWKGSGWKGKTLWVGLVVLVFGFLPVKGMIEQAKKDAYAREAWAYFKRKCDTEAGEKIYKTFRGVKSVLITKPLPPATEKDLYDQYWYGDPYSNATPWDKRGITAADTFLRELKLFGAASEGFEFVEIRKAPLNGHTFLKIQPSVTRHATNEISTLDKPVSRFGVSWEDISTRIDRSYWVAGSRLRVIDLTDNSIVAERVGYLIETGFGSMSGNRRPWLSSRGPGTTCPPLKNGSYEDRLFVLKALTPAEEKK